MTGNGLRKARIIALFVPSALLGGAYFSQFAMGLYPCEMCYWQRWPHMAAIAFAIMAFIFAKNPAFSKILTGCAALAIAVSGAIGVFHAGVEYGWWEGVTSCTANVGASGGNILDDIMGASIVRCDEVQWQMLGISMAGYNAMISLASAIYIAISLKK